MNEDTARKYSQLIERLYAKTLSREIKWQLDVNRLPKAEFGGYIIRLHNGRSGGNPFEYLSLYSDFEEIIETIDDDDVSAFTPDVGSFTSYYLLMEDLRGLAFRQAVGADKALDDLLGKLDDDL